jgi:hypothetical protein
MELLNIVASATIHVINEIGVKVSKSGYLYGEGHISCSHAIQLYALIRVCSMAYMPSSDWVAKFFEHEPYIVDGTMAGII